MMNDFGTALRKIRKSKRMTIQQLADASRMCATSISNIERGITVPPARNHIDNLLAALDCGDRIEELLRLAIRSRPSIELVMPWGPRYETLREMLVVLCEKIDADAIDADTAGQITGILQSL